MILLAGADPVDGKDGLSTVGGEMRGRGRKIRVDSPKGKISVSGKIF